ncbi:MAG: malic enzyme-like NAD(P)-binding protein, partial [Candidatus Geothermarchaeales archaeon]
DSKGILHQGRTDLEARKEEEPIKWEMCLKTNAEGRTGGIPEAMKDTDICIAMAVSKPGTIKKEWVSSMATDSIVFACANPLPEIWPWDATEAGAKVVATGRSDFEGYSQVNNSLGFPGIFRGVLDVRAKTITDTMCIEAAKELAKCAEDKGITEGYIIPTMEEWEVYPREATAVALQAIKEGLARLKLSRQEIYERSSAIIKRSRDLTQFMMKEKFIQPPPK